MRLLCLIIALTLPSRSEATDLSLCDTALNACNTYVHALRVENGVLETTLREVRAQRDEAVQKALPPEAPKIPFFVWIGIGFVAGVVVSQVVR